MTTVTMLVQICHSLHLWQPFTQSLFGLVLNTVSTVLPVPPIFHHGLFLFALEPVLPSMPTYECIYNVHRCQVTRCSKLVFRLQSTVSEVHSQTGYEEKIRTLEVLNYPDSTATFTDYYKFGRHHMLA